MLGNFLYDLSKYFYFVKVINAARVFFEVSSSAVAIFVLGESFNCSNFLS